MCSFFLWRRVGKGGERGLFGLIFSLFWVWCVCVCGGGGGDFAECIAVDAFVYCHEVLMYVYTAHVFHCARDCCHSAPGI